MSAHATRTRAPRRHDQAHGTRRGYLTGFVLSVVLTAIPFWLVMGGRSATADDRLVIIGAGARADRGAHDLLPAHERAGPRAAGRCWRCMFTLVIVVITLERIALGDVPPQQQHDAGHAIGRRGRHVRRSGEAARVRRVGLGLLALLAVASLVSLGVWQLHRRVWKLALIEQVDRRLAAPPVTAPGPAAWPTIGRGDVYTRVAVHGLLRNDRRDLRAGGVRSRCWLLGAHSDEGR